MALVASFANKAGQGRQPGRTSTRCRENQRAFVICSGADGLRAPGADSRFGTLVSAGFGDRLRLAASSTLHTRPVPPRWVQAALRSRSAGQLLNSRAAFTPVAWNGCCRAAHLTAHRTVVVADGVGGRPGSSSGFGAGQRLHHIGIGYERAHVRGRRHSPESG